jgi:hypothetical protein
MAIARQAGSGHPPDPLCELFHVKQPSRLAVAGST